jgi:hypothetical protein
MGILQQVDAHAERMAVWYTRYLISFRAMNHGGTQ